MRRFYVSPEAATAAEIVLPAGEAHHALSVLRLKAGASVVVLDGQGKEFRGSFIPQGKRAASVRVEETIQHPPPICQVTLFPAMLKGKLMDWVVEKATELGVTEIIPVITENTVSHPAADRSVGKVAKWRTTAIAAIKQCGNPWLPEINAPQPLYEILRHRVPAELSLAAILGEQAVSIRHAVDQCARVRSEPPRSIEYWVGPEGDFTSNEQEQLRGRGTISVTLGPRVLRAETAVVTGVAMILGELIS